MRRQPLEAAAAAVAGKMLAVDFDPPFVLRHVVDRVGDMQHALAQGQCVLHAVGQAAADVGTQRDAIDHHFHQMLAAAIDAGRFVDRERLPSTRTRT